MYREVVSIAAGVLLLAPILTSAQSIAELQAQIQALLQHVTALEAQLGVTPGAPAPVSPAQPGGACVVITRIISLGASGNDVAALQRFLARDSSLYPEGNVTGYFGALTRAALQRFQVRHNIVSSGNAWSTGYGAVGSRTQALIRSLSCPTGTPGVSGTPSPLPVPLLPCNVGGISLPSGSGATFYRLSSVSSDSVCQAQARQCVNGTFTGDPSFQYPSCTIAAPISCRQDGITIPPGESQIFYSSSTVPYGTSCSSVGRTRTCENGDLSGSSRYRYASCTNAAPGACVLDGITVSHGSSRTFYTKRTIPFGESCTTYGQSRTCTSGTFSGSSDYDKAYCTPASSNSCTLDGTPVANGSSKVFYSSRTGPVGNTCASISQSRTCTKGILAGDDDFKYASCTAASCTLDGATVAHAGKRTFYSAMSVGFGGSCSSIAQLRTCTNGQFDGSDTYNKANCSVGGAASCTYNSETVTHGGTRTFYKQSSVAFNQQCNTSTNAKNKTCTNGSWVGDALFPSTSCAIGTQSAATCTLTATPSVVKPNDPITFNWTTQNASGGTLFNAAISPVAQGSRISGGYSTVGDRTVTLSVTGSGGSGQCSALVKVQSALPPSCTLKAKKTTSATWFTASPITVNYADTPLTLQWTSTGATDYASSTPSMGVSATTSVGVAGANHTPVTKETSYTYIFNNSGGSTQCTMAVNYNLPTCTLTSNKTSYIYGDPVTLTWTSTNADYATATSTDHNAPNGAITFPNATANMTYIFTFNGLGGQTSCSKAITVQKPLTVNSPTGGTYQKGDDVTISWQYTGTPPSNSGVYLALVDPDGVQVGNALIAAQQLTTSGYTWNVPDTLGTQNITSGDYKIRAVVYGPKSACTASGCTGATIYARADSGTISLSTGITGAIVQNLANALAALESALKALIVWLGP